MEVHFTPPNPASFPRVEGSFVSFALYRWDHTMSIVLKIDFVYEITLFFDIQEMWGLSARMVVHRFISQIFCRRTFGWFLAFCYNKHVHNEDSFTIQSVCMCVFFFIGQTLRHGIRGFKYTPFEK